MTRHDIITLPDPILRQRSQRVGYVDESVTNSIHDMEAATLDWEDHRHSEVGVALAAVQIGQLQRIIIIRNDFDNKQDRSFHAFINPKIVKRTGTPTIAPEGCLSIRDIYGSVPRYPTVKVKAQTPEGAHIKFKAQGFLARILQHEIDHLQGTLFIDHIEDKDKGLFKLNEQGELIPLHDEDKQTYHFLWDEPV